jgi:RimJ/RimL family protein N-acetyltransferase
MERNSIRVEKLSPENWRDLSRSAYLVCFNSDRKPEDDRIDYALFAVRGEMPLGFVTVRDLDRTTGYWQYGGTFPGTVGTTAVLPVMREFIAEMKERGYERVSFRVRNTNRPMLKLAFHLGFSIVGVRVVKDEVYLEHVLDWKEEKTS